MSDEKLLYLVRHAKSSWKEPGLTDFERPLNKRGKRDLVTMSKRMHKRKDQVDIIITSPAVRALTTADGFAKRLEVPPAQFIRDIQIYEASTANLLGVIQRLKPDWHQVMLVGHNPGLTHLANLWAASAIANLPTCSIIAFRFATPDWSMVGSLPATMTYFDYPKKQD